MHLLARCRTAAARHPLVYWGLVAALGVVAVGTTWHERARVASARDAWGTTRVVAVTVHDLVPGDRPDVRPVALPVAMLPEAALDPDALTADAVVVQHVGAGEVLTTFDLGSGPLALLPPGWIALAVRLEPPPAVAIGDAVRLLTGDGVLADAAVVTGVDDNVITVGVPEQIAPTVAEAARLQVLTLGLVRPE